MHRIISMGIDYATICIVAIPLTVVSFVLSKDLQIKYMVFEITILLSLWMCKDLVGGRSIGKRILGYEVKIADDFSENIWRFIARNIFIIIWPIEIIFCFLNPERRLGDLLFGTKVSFYDKKSDSSIVYFQKKKIILSFIITFFIILLIVCFIMYLISCMDFLMVKLLFSPINME